MVLMKLDFSVYPEDKPIFLVVNKELINMLIDGQVQ